VTVNDRDGPGLGGERDASKHTSGSDLADMPLEMLVLEVLLDATAGDC